MPVGKTTVAELLARAFYKRVRPHGPPFDMLKDSERDLWVAAGADALEEIWQLDD